MFNITTHSCKLLTDYLTTKNLSVHLQTFILYLQALSVQRFLTVKEYPKSRFQKYI